MLRRILYTCSSLFRLGSTIRDSNRHDEVRHLQHMRNANTSSLRSVRVGVNEQNRALGYNHKKRQHSLVIEPISGSVNIAVSFHLCVADSVVYRRLRAHNYLKVIKR